MSVRAPRNRDTVIWLLIDCNRQYSSIQNDVRWRKTDTMLRKRVTWYHYCTGKCLVHCSEFWLYVFCGTSRARPYIYTVLYLIRNKIICADGGPGESSKSTSKVIRVKPSSPHQPTSVCHLLSSYAPTASAWRTHLGRGTLSVFSNASLCRKRISFCRSCRTVERPYAYPIFFSFLSSLVHLL